MNHDWCLHEFLALHERRARIVEVMSFTKRMRHGNDNLKGHSSEKRIVDVGRESISSGLTSNPSFVHVVILNLLVPV